MSDAFREMYEVVANRRENPQEGSYTCYLFGKGLDKILKKCGEECTEMVIAAKNADNEELANEINDLLYHMAVLMVERGVTVDEIEDIMRERSKKIGNLKQFHVSDHNT
ncbi:MAG: phosphoribosyl-ATP diphosphatase [Oscillospiraceae bacterium]